MATKAIYDKIEDLNVFPVILPSIRRLKSQNPHNNHHITMNSASPIIKVVSLKRFMPETVLKPTRTLQRPHYSVLNLEPFKKSKIGHKIQTAEKPVTCDVEPSHCQDSQVLVNRSKIKFRYCSHSPEELATLHEHVCETLVKLGDTFESRDSLRQYLNDNARTWHYYYVCRSSKSKVLEYTCICMAYNNKKSEAGIRKQTKRTTACPCKLRLTVDEVTNKLVVYYVCNHHDHPTTASAFSKYPHAKYLPQHVKEEFLDLTYAGLDVTLIQKYIFSVVGLKIKKKDIWSYSYRFRKRVYTRDYSEQRIQFIEDLIKKIRETFGETADLDSTDLVEYPSCNISSSPNNELDINPNDDSFYKGLGDHSLGIDTEVIVQYIKEDGLLCDQNSLVTNNIDLMQVINNMYVVAGNTEDNIKIGGNVLSESGTGEELYVLDWPVPSKSLSGAYKSITNVEENHFYANDKSDEELSRNCSAMNSDCVYGNRLSPTPETPAVYAEIDTFNKYYYVDHRYVTYENQTNEKLNAIRHNSKVPHSAISFTPDVYREEYITAPKAFAFGSPTFRHCSGHDHLDSLHDPDAITAGAMFLTLDAFLSYVNKRAHTWFFYYSLAESGKSPEYYAYKCVYGKHRVSKNAYRAKGLRKRNKLTTDCPCLIRLRRLDSSPDYLTVLYSCNHHDHPRDERQFNSQVHSRRLPPHMKEEIKDLVMLRVSSDVLRKYVLDETGLTITGKYFYNLWAGMRRRNEERHLTDERVAFLNEKINDLAAKYGDIQSKNRKESLQDEMADSLSPADTDKTKRQIEECHELQDFGEEVFIVQSDDLPEENSAKQSRLETRLQNLPRNEIWLKVKKLQEWVRCEGQRTDELIVD